MNVFKTPDMYLFAFLMAKGYHVERIVKNKKRCIFHIEDKEARKQDVKDYHNNTPIGVADFKNALQSVRGMIRDISISNHTAWANFEDVGKK